MMERARDLRLRYSDWLYRGGKLYRLVPGNAGACLVEVDQGQMGQAGLRRYLRLSNAMTITRWVRAGMPHIVVAGRRVFSVPEVSGWLEAHGYDVRKMRQGKGPLGSRVREGRRTWRKGGLTASEEGEKP